MNKKKIIIKSKRSILNDYFKIDEVYLQHEKFDGSISKEIRRLSFNREDTCSVLMYDKTLKAILLINQFRYPVYTKDDGFLLEIPAGIIEKEEQPKEAIRREILEETGYLIDDLVFLFSYFTSPGITSERCFLFFTEIDISQKTSQGGGCAEESEDIQVQWIQVEDIKTLIKSGTIKDAKTIIALYWFLLNQDFVNI